MAELKVTFKLSDRDVAHLRRIMRKASSKAKHSDEDAIMKAAIAIAGEVRKFKPPQYVLERVLRLESLMQIEFGELNAKETFIQPTNGKEVSP